MGQCASCGEPVCRGDSFVVTLADATLHTGCIKPYFDGLRAKASEPEPAAPAITYRIAGDEDPF